MSKKMSDREFENRVLLIMVLAVWGGMLLMYSLGCATTEPPKQFTVAEAAVKSTAAKTTSTCTGEQDPWFAGSCLGQPSKDKVYGAHKYVHGGRIYSAVVHGNDLYLHRLTGSVASRSDCDVTLVGDEDYAAMSPVLCDECEYGFLGYSTSLCAFRVLEINGVPRITDEHQLGYSAVPGAFTFRYDGHQYLIGQAADLDCGADSGLYRIDAVDSYTLVECLPSREIVTGVDLGGGYLALGDANQYVMIYRIGGE